jgi:hypothetical protein
VHEPVRDRSAANIERAGSALSHCVEFRDDVASAGSGGGRGAGLAEGADQRAFAAEEFGDQVGIGRREGRPRGQAAGGEDLGGAVG